MWAYASWPGILMMCYLHRETVEVEIIIIIIIFIQYPMYIEIRVQWTI